jgi:hypothetical protein
LAAEIVVVTPPVLVTVSDLLLLLPTWMLPKARVDKLAESVAGVTPVPDNGMLRLGFDPSDVMLTLPVDDPVDVGANNTLNEVLSPAARVSGKVRPLRL